MTSQTNIHSPQDINNAKWFFDFFKKIPTEKWTIRDLSKPDGTKCALGHLGATKNERGYYIHTKESLDLMALMGESIVSVNDRPRYLGKKVYSPKRNVLRALARYIKGKPRESRFLV